MKKDNSMKVLTERQKNDATFNKKTGTLTKQKEKELYTKYIIDREEKEKEKEKEKETDVRKLEIYARKFIESFKDSRIHQDELGTQKDFIKLGKIIRNKADLQLPNKMAQFIAKKYLYKTDPKSLISKNENIQMDAVLSQSDHKPQNIKKDTFEGFGNNKNYLIKLSVGALLGGINKLNSPDCILIKWENGYYNFYFVELKNSKLYKTNEITKESKTLTPEGKYLSYFLGKNNISKLQRIGVCSDTKDAVKKFKLREKISQNSKIMTNQEFASFSQGAIPIVGTVSGDHLKLSSHPVLEKIFTSFTKKGLEKDVPTVETAIKQRLLEKVKQAKYKAMVNKLPWPPTEEYAKKEGIPYPATIQNISKIAKEESIKKTGETVENKKFREGGYINEKGVPTVQQLKRNIDDFIAFTKNIKKINWLSNTSNLINKERNVIER